MGAGPMKGADKTDRLAAFICGTTACARHQKLSNSLTAMILIDDQIINIQGAAGGQIMHYPEADEPDSTPILPRSEKVIALGLGLSRPLQIAFESDGAS